MSSREPYRSPEQKLADCEELLERSQSNELRLASRNADLKSTIKDLADVLTSLALCSRYSIGDARFSWPSHIKNIKIAADTLESVLNKMNDL